MQLRMTLPFQDSKFLLQNVTILTAEQPLIYDKKSYAVIPLMKQKQSRIV